MFRSGFHYRKLTTHTSLLRKKKHGHSTKHHKHKKRHSSTHSIFSKTNRQNYHGIQAVLSIEGCKINFVDQSDIKTLGRLSCACRLFHESFKISLETLRAHEIAQSIVTNPNWLLIKKLKSMLDRNPQLVELKFKEVQDKAKRKIRNYTLLQLAYGAQDDELCRILVPYFIRAYGSQRLGRKAIRAQIKEKKFNILDVNEEERIKNQLLTILRALIQAINE